MPSSEDQDREQKALLTSSRDPPPSTPKPLSSAFQFSPSRHRPTFQRVPTIPGTDEIDHAGDDDITEAPVVSPHDGLGISGTLNPSRARRVTISAAHDEGPYSGRESPSQHSVKFSEHLVTPPSAGALSGSTRYEGSRGDDMQGSPRRPFAKGSYTSFQSMNTPASNYSDNDMLLKGSATASIKSKFDDWGSDHRCVEPTRASASSLSWVSLTIMALSIYSTALSALFLIISIIGPRYGRLIRTGSSFTISDASVVVGLLAKTVELSFVTCFVAFLGQALARRAIDKRYSGVTLAELSMRQWIMQPGTLITHWESVRYAGISILGVLSVLATIMSVLYTTACNGLVLPQLKFNKWQRRWLQGLVKTIFANPQYIQQNCQMPVGARQDPVEAETTCIQMEHAAMAYHNYFSYMGRWSQLNKNGTGSIELPSRPPGYALVYDNTTITAPWVGVNNTNTTDLWYKENIIVNNVTMAMPHAGVLQAAIDPINGIVQPQELDGQGVYSLHASVPSPIINVLCATLNYSTIKPLIYDAWPGRNRSLLNFTTWPEGVEYRDPFLTKKLAGSPLKKLFRWDPDLDPYGWPPVFPILPDPYNTVINDTEKMTYGRKNIYLLGTSGNVTNTGDPLPYYFSGDERPYAYSLCQMQVGYTPFCSTRYNASSSGGTLEALCEDENDSLQYIKSLPVATSGNASLNPDWPNIASMWSKSLSLNDGFLGANASNARLLNQMMMIPGWSGIPQLSGGQPSMAEALAVMAGCTLIQSSTDSPFVTFWNYTNLDSNMLTPGQYQFFNASIRAQEYASGGIDSSQKGWFVVLFTVFIINAIILGYFCVHRRWYPDFSEPQNLFNIAVNSPPSDHVSCGGHPRGNEYKLPWTVTTSESGHVFIEEKHSEGERIGHTLKRRVSAFTDKVSDSPLFTPNSWGNIRNWGKPTSPGFERHRNKSGTTK